MPIYSNNRSGSVMSSQVACNENYTDMDLAKILYESTVNDMAIFEAIVINDLTEIQAVREGTILLEEVAEKNEKGFKKVIERLKEIVANFWAKIKGAIRAAINKIGAYILKNNSSFIKNYNDVMERKTKADGVRVKSVDVDLALYDIDEYISKIPSVKSIEDVIRKEFEDHTIGAPSQGDSVNSAEFTKKVYGDIVPGAEDSSSFATKAMESIGIKTYKFVNRSNEGDFINILENASTSIKNLKRLESAIKDGVDNINAVLTKSINSFSKDYGKDNVYGDQTKILTTLVSVYQNVATTVTSVGISMVKANVKTARKALYTLMHEGIVKEDAELATVALDVDNADASEVLDAPEVPVLDTDTQEEINKIEADCE